MKTKFEKFCSSIVEGKNYKCILQNIRLIVGTALATFAFTIFLKIHIYVFPLSPLMFALLLSWSFYFIATWFKSK